MLDRRKLLNIGSLAPMFLAVPSSGLAQSDPTCMAVKAWNFRSLVLDEAVFRTIGRSGHKRPRQFDDCGLFQFDPNIAQ